MYVVPSIGYVLAKHFCTHDLASHVPTFLEQCRGEAEDLKIYASALSHQAMLTLLDQESFGDFETQGHDIA
jgi:hypothetical protein